MNSQPLPDSLQESIWNFVREHIRRYEERIGAKVAEYEIHLSGAGQIEVEVLATESPSDAALDEGLEEAGSKAEVNRLKVRELLANDIEKS
jgi:phage baseplate assembly protein W